MKRLRFLISMLLCIAMLFSAAACNTDTSDVYKLNKTSITLEVGQTEKLSVSDDAGNAVSAVFSSDDEAVATVAEDGTVTAVKAGSATVTAKVNDSVSLTCSVTVTGGEEGPVEYDYALNYSSLTMRVSESKQLFVNVSPEKQITPEWSVEDDTIVSISANGTVTALKEGKTKVSAAVDGKTLTCDVTVQAKYTFILDCTQLTTKEGSTRQLNIVTVPDLEDDDSLPAFVWATTDEDVATVKDGLVTAVGKGDATITATYGTVQLACEVTVEEQIYSYQLNETSLVMEEGDSETLKVTSFPAQSSISVTWTTSNEDVATVEDGEVTAVGAGTAVITASVDGTKLTCSVTVNYPAGEEGVTAQATVTNIEGSSVNLTDAGAADGLETLYWEKYEGGKIITKADADDIITANRDLTVDVGSAEGFGGFSDYKAKISWTGGDPTASGSNDANGVCVRSELRLTIEVDPTVKEIRLYSGAWRATNSTALYLGTTKLAASEEFSTDEPASARMITYKLDIEEERTLTLVIDPKGMYDGGNNSLVAIAVLGNEISYKLSNSTLNLTEQETQKLSVTCSVPDTQFTVEYESSDDKVATVAKDGTVTAVAEGKATITATVNGTEKLTCTVNVTKQPVTYKYELNKTQLTLDPNGTETLSVIVTPDKDITVKWTSNNDEVATVDENGKVTAVGEGKATITASVDGQELNCAVTVNAPAASASVSANDIGGQNITLEQLSDTYSVLYWEHYQGGRIDAMRNAEDVISTDENLTDTNSFGAFGDYKATMSWYAGQPAAAYYQNPNGICVRKDVSIDIQVDPSVKEIRVFTGAWFATNNTKLLWNGVQIAASEPFAVTEPAVAKMITYTVDVEKETTLTLLLSPTERDMDKNGNMSLVAIAVPGEGEKAAATTEVSLLKKTEMTSNANVYDLTEIGDIDWFVTHHSSGSDEKKDGTAFDGESLAFNSASFWDYRAAFTWTDGTVCASDPSDNGVSGDYQQPAKGTNNGKCGSYVNIDVTVPAGETELVLWAGGWQSTYYIEIIDSNNNIIFSEKIADKTTDNEPYMVELSVNSEKGETLTAVVYHTDKNERGNCSLAAIALRNPSEEPEVPDYALNKSALELTVGAEEQLIVSPSADSVEWSVKDGEIASVTDGLVSALKAGSTEVYAKIGDVTLTCTVKVTDAQQPEYEYSISDATLTLDLGGTKTAKLSVTAEPQKDDISLAWESSDTTVVTVDDSGNVTAVGVGTATITVIADGDTTLTCTVTVKYDGASVSSETIAEQRRENLTDIEGVLDWEYYGNKNDADRMLGSTDIIDNETADNANVTFNDYKLYMNWSNGTKNVAWIGDGNKNGRTLADGLSFTVSVPAGESKIYVYTGAWNATNLTELYDGTTRIAAAEKIVATHPSINVKIVFSVTSETARTLTVKINSLDRASNGNVSIVAVAVAGTAQTTTSVSLSNKTEMTSSAEQIVNLTERGTIDWYYLNDNNENSVQKTDGTAILTDTVKISNQNGFGDYRASFTWTDGTGEVPDDDNSGSVGTNNGKCGNYVQIDIGVTEATNEIVLWVGGYDNAEYYVEVLDENGIVLINELVGTSSAGDSLAYEVELGIEATASETLTVIVYRATGANCSMAAVAVA